MPKHTLKDVSERMRQFTEARNWETFHTPKNLSMALIVEAAELVEHFQWMTPEQSLNLSESRKDEVARELADILIYLTRIADVLDVDLVEAAMAKFSANERKYPADRVSPEEIKPPDDLDD